MISSSGLEGLDISGIEQNRQSIRNLLLDPKGHYDTPISPDLDIAKRFFYWSTPAGLPSAPTRPAARKHFVGAAKTPYWRIPARSLRHILRHTLHVPAKFGRVTVTRRCVL